MIGVDGRVIEGHTFLTDLILLLLDGVGAVILVEERVDIVLVPRLKPPAARWG